MGEFPWQVRVGETVNVKDYVAPPETISAEETAGEVVWSIGTYTRGAEVWKAFGLKGSPPAPIGVYANQPSPYQGRAGSAWAVFFLLTLLLLTTMFLVGIAAPREEVFRQKYTFRIRNRRTLVCDSDIFQLKGGQANVEVSINTNLDNDWAYMALALINDDTGVAYDFGKEIELLSRARQRWIVERRRKQR